MRFSKAELESFRDVEVPDLLADELRLLFVGINPGLWTAAVQTHFAHPVNRFYPALLRAGVLTEAVSPSDGMTDADREQFRARGLGITNLAPRATARADELTAAELRDGGAPLRELVRAVLRESSRSSASLPTGRRSATGRRSSAGRTGGSRAPSCGSCPTPAVSTPTRPIASLAEAYAGPARAAGVL